VDLKGHIANHDDSFTLRFSHQVTAAREVPIKASDQRFNVVAFKQPL
jgi:hypothetical protein